MNKRSYPFSDLNIWLSKVEEIYIFLSEKPSLDQVAAACALSSSLKNSHKGAVVVAPQSMRVEFNQVYGVDKIRNKINGRSFVVSIDYPLANVEKVAWDDREPKVKLIIQPKIGVPIIEKEMVSFLSQGGVVKNAIGMGVRSLEEWQAILNRLGGENQRLEEVSIVNVNVGSVSSEGNFGQIKVIDPSASSFCEVTAALIEGLSLSVGEPEASNLLLGLQAATNSFSDSQLKPDAFEAAAFCLRAGGKIVNKAAEQSSSFGKPKIYRGNSPL